MDGDEVPPQHYRKPGHLIDRCFNLYPKLKPQLTQNSSGGRRGGRGRGRGTSRIGAIVEVESMHSKLTNLNQLQTQLLNCYRTWVWLPPPLVP